jgi:hypothetical protein
MKPREPRDSRGLALAGRSERVEGEDEGAAMHGLHGRCSRGRGHESEHKPEHEACERAPFIRQHLDRLYYNEHGDRLPNRRRRPQPSNESAIRSPTITAGRFVLARGITGISEQSATTVPSSPRTRPAPSHTASGSSPAPIAHVPDGW